MDDDSQTPTGSKEQPEGERQNRRQFFNGLGKWSLAVIAAVTALREGMGDLQSVIGSRFETPSAAAADRRQQIAKKKGPHGDQPHLDDPGFNNKGTHQDYYRILE
jgi:hypothetical protein